MSIRTLTKALAGIQDMLFGRGTATQIRNGTSYSIDRIAKIHPVDLLVDLKALPTIDEDNQYFEVHLKGTTAINDGNGGVFYWDAASTDVADDLSVVEADDVGALAGRWIKLTSDAVQRTGDTMTGQLKGITPVAANDLTRKDYVDAVFNQHIAGLTSTSRTLAFASDLDTIAVTSVYSGDITGVTNGPVDFTAGDFLVATTISSSASADYRVQEIIATTSGSKWYRYTTTGNAGWSTWLAPTKPPNATTAISSNDAASGANTWCKLATLTPTTDDNTSGVVEYSVTGKRASGRGVARIIFRYASSSGVLNVADTTIAVYGNTFTTHVSGTSFKITAPDDTLGGPIELWMTKDANFGAFELYEVTNSVDGLSTVFETDSEWTATVPTGTFSQTSVYHQVANNLLGNVVGNVTGSSGSCTGNSATSTTAASCSGNSATATTFSTGRAITATGGNVIGTSAATADGNYVIALNATGLTAGHMDYMTAGSIPINWKDGPIATAAAWPTFSAMIACYSLGFGTIRVHRTHNGSSMYTAVYKNGVSVEGTGYTGTGVKTTDLSVVFGDLITINGNFSTDGFQPGDTISNIYCGISSGMPLISEWY